MNHFASCCFTTKKADVINSHELKTESDRNKSESSDDFKIISITINAVHN